MKTLRHHLLMEENLIQSQVKDRSSHHTGFHLGEDRKRNGNKKSFWVRPVFLVAGELLTTTPIANQDPRRPLLKHLATPKT
jgi:hypothetical protein